MISPIKNNVTGISRNTISEVFDEIGISNQKFHFTNFHASGNNKLFKVSTDDALYVFKHYFSSKYDKRDRMGAEFRFLGHACKFAPEFVPKFYGKSERHRISVMSFISGNEIDEGNISEDSIKSALSFFSKINSLEAKKSWCDGQLASDASFSISGHIRIIDRRLKQLEEIDAKVEMSFEALKLVARAIKIWNEIKNDLMFHANKTYLNMEEKLERQLKCISPSDFGFHNAIKASNGKNYFVDFEYAGWDDPAKTICDFFEQVAVPLSESKWEMVSQNMSNNFIYPSLIYQRAEKLRSLFSMKWFCILMNIFVRVNLERRVFANPNLNIRKYKESQLIKAKEKLDRAEGFLNE